MRQLRSGETIATRPTRKPSAWTLGASTRSLPWEIRNRGAGREGLPASAGRSGRPRSSDRDRSLAESCARGERRCRFATLGMHAVLQCALVAGLRADERWTRGERPVRSRSGAKRGGHARLPRPAKPHRTATRPDRPPTAASPPPEIRKSPICRPNHPHRGGQKPAPRRRLFPGQVARPQPRM